MATVRVSNNSQLQSALKSAGSGTKIELSSGTYSLSASGGDFHNAVITEAAGAKVNFSSVQLTNVKHLTFDGVGFQLHAGQRGIFIQGGSDIAIENSDLNGATSKGTVGLMVSKSTGFSLQNSHFTGFETAVKFTNITDLTVTNNSWSNVSWDAMIIGSVHDALFQGNDISLNVPGGRKHTDAMQFYNTGDKVASSDVTIRDNTIHTHNSQSHGIYIYNELVEGGAGSSHYYKNFTIDHNTIVSGQVSGIAVGQTNGLKITNNILLQDTANRSGLPVIRVEHDSTGVSITGNVTHVQPVASGANWQPTGKAEPSWTIANNKIVSTGTSVAAAESLAPNAGAASSGASAGAASAALASAKSSTLAVASAAASATSTHTAAAGDGSTDTFHFYADARSKAATHLTGLDFGVGDKLALHGFDAGSFHDLAGGNALEVSADGAFVQIDSLADLRELDQASAKVSVHTNGDVLVLDVAQAGEADHLFKLHGLGHAYADLA